MSHDGSDGTYRLVFVYDENGSPLCFDLYSGSNTTSVRYYYVTNLQGDVVRLINSNNATVADYTYDAWGKLLGVTDANGNAITSEYHIANINPLRYRGYFYDTETKLYYCNSRYYDPQVRRFVGADEIVATGQGFSGTNMFAYCGNNPVVRVDTEGEFWNTIVGAVAGAISGCINAIVTGSDMVESVVAGAVSGAAQGAVLDLIALAPISGGASLAIAVAAGGVISGVTSALTQAYDRDEGFDSSNIDWTGVAIDAAWGMVGETLSFGLADVKGENFETLPQIFSKTKKEIITKSISDVTDSTLVAVGTSIGAAKTNKLSAKDISYKKARTNYCRRSIYETQKVYW